MEKTIKDILNPGKTAFEKRVIDLLKRLCEAFEDIAESLEHIEEKK